MKSNGLFFCSLGLLLFVSGSAVSAREQTSAHLDIPLGISTGVYADAEGCFVDVRPGTWLPDTDEAEPSISFSFNGMIDAEVTGDGALQRGMCIGFDGTGAGRGSKLILIADKNSSRIFQLRCDLGFDPKARRVGVRSHVTFEVDSQGRIVSASGEYRQYKRRALFSPLDRVIFRKFDCKRLVPVDT